LATIRSCQARRIAPRLFAVSARQAGQAALAASMARRVSAAPMSGTAASIAPVAGLAMLTVAPLSAAVHVPAMKACSRNRPGSRNCMTISPFFLGAYSSLPE
jgi:hypothetical protein